MHTTTNDVHWYGLDPIPCATTVCNGTLLEETVSYAAQQDRQDDLRVGPRSGSARSSYLELGCPESARVCRCLTWNLRSQVSRTRGPRRSHKKCPVEDRPSTASRGYGIHVDARCIAWRNGRHTDNRTRTRGVREMAITKTTESRTGKATQWDFTFIYRNGSLQKYRRGS